MAAWLRGWKETLRLMIFERDLYRQLRESIATPMDEFTEVSRPA